MIENIAKVKLNSRKGIIRTSTDFVFTFSEEMIKPIFAEIFPYDIAQIDANNVDYSCISNRFRTLEEGEGVPYYDISIVRTNNRYYIEDVTEVPAPVNNEENISIL